MIEIIKGHVRWSEGYANPPSLELLVTRIPKLEEHRYEKRGTLYYAETEGIVSFFSWGGRPDRGYGGHTFHITMQDGTPVDLVGPWSGNATAMNQAGFGPCVDVALVDDPQAYERGYTFSAGAITMELLGRHRDMITLPPYRLNSKGESWKGFDLVAHFPEGSRFTMLQTTKDGRSSRGPVMDASTEQAILLGQMPMFVPIVELPDGGYWVKPSTSRETAADLPPSCRIEPMAFTKGMSTTYGPRADL